MAESSDLPPGWEVIGWETKDGEWMNPQQGDSLPDGDELVDSYQTVVEYTDDEGLTHTYSVMGGVDEWEGLIDAIHDLEDKYELA